MSPRRITDVATEIAVAALSLVVTFGLARFFIDLRWRADLVTLVVASHLLALVVRRAGFGMGISAVVSAAGMLVVSNVVLFPETSGSVIPTGETLDLVRSDLEAAWNAFELQQAPVEPLRGFVAAAGLALWWAVVLADWAAFRLRSMPETITPATTIFVFTVLLGDGSHPVIHAALFVAAVGAVILSLRLSRQARDNVWVASGAAAGLSSTMRAGLVAAGIALSVGVVAGPAMPDAGEQLLDPSEWDNGPETRRVTSPLVEISASLLDQTERELFSVGVDDPIDRHYWRQMALTEFNGREWRRSSSFDDANGRVPTNIASTVNRTTVLQEITTTALGGIYLPAAYEISNVLTSGDVELEYEVETGALVVKRKFEQRARAGFTYVIESQVPNYDPAALPTTATDGLGADFVAQHTQLPEECLDGQTTVDTCWNPDITRAAEAITAGASTDYERIVALQNFFVDPNNFSYNIQVALDHDINSMERFLFDVREGYCEQFASTFAAMARSIGIPTRVAVGFTWGEWDAARRAFVVRGEHAHAWPEVFFADVGWVVLDPTPGRAPAHNQSFARLAPAQLGENDAGNRELGDGSAPTTLPAPTPTGGTNAAPSVPDQPEPGPDDLLAEPAGMGSMPGDQDDGRDWSPLLRLVAAIGGVIAIVGAVPLVRIVSRRRRGMRVADDPVGRSELAWDDATAALRLIGIVPSPAETPMEFASRALQHHRPVGPVDELAVAITTLRYAKLSDPISVSHEAERAATAVAEQCRAQVSSSTRWSDAIDPRTITMN